jgi:hypothetical protein
VDIAYPARQPFNQLSAKNSSSSRWDASLAVNLAGGSRRDVNQDS